MRLTASLLGAAMMVMLPMLALAGDYHMGGTLVCSDCHVMHGQQSHGYSPDGSGFYVVPGGALPHEYLLRNEVNDLCLTCHDNSSFGPDVLGANFGTYVRQAGALNRLTPAVGQPATGHTLGSTDPAPGGTWSDADGLHCTNCHQPHGFNPAGNPYRNLAHDVGDYGFGGSFVSYATGVIDTLVDVYQAAAAPRNVHYSYDNIFFLEPDPTKSAYADFCKGCHTNFHGDKGDPLTLGGALGVEWLRHPTNDADIGAVGGGHSSLADFTAHTNRVQVMSHSGVWDPPAADNTPSCMSCHKAHGNQNAFGLIYMRGTGDVDEEGDDGVFAKDLCKQCHVQG